jgi:hypothetical protein
MGISAGRKMVFRVGALVLFMRGVRFAKTETGGPKAICLRNMILFWCGRNYEVSY